jgi:HEAT repeat protein
MPADSFADRQYDQAVDVLDALPRDISEPILHSLEKTSDKGVRLWAASSLLQRSRLSVLKQIAPLLMTPNAETEDSAEYAASMFPNEGLPADLLPTLVMLLRSKAGFVRSAAASALASSPSLETRREIVRAILRETDKETLQGEASALCELQNDYRRCESFRGTIDESVTDSALREWATQQLAQPLPPDYRVNN